MRIIKYHDIEMAHDFLVSVFGESLTESSEIAFNDFFVSKLPLHKVLLEHYKVVFNIMKTITDKLLENSNLNTKIDDKFINLLLYQFSIFCNFTANLRTWQPSKFCSN